MEKTFDIDGRTYQYPISLWDANNYERVVYRNETLRGLQQKRTQEELKGLPLSEKVRRYSKNLGIELLASTIEGLTAFLRIGGMHINCDELRGEKEPTYHSYKIEQEKREAVRY